MHGSEKFASRVEFCMFPRLQIPYTLAIYLLIDEATNNYLYPHQALKNSEEQPTPLCRDRLAPWFTFASPHLFAQIDDDSVTCTQDLPTNTAVGLELIVLLAQPQPSWTLLVKVGHGDVDLNLVVLVSRGKSKVECGMTSR